MQKKHNKKSLFSVRKIKIGGAPKAARARTRIRQSKIKAKKAAARTFNLKTKYKSFYKGLGKKLPKLTGRQKDIAKKGAIIFATLALTLLVYFRNQAGEWFKASVLEMPQPFNGTVLPVAKVPDWTNWKGDNTTTKYSDISASSLIDMPAYDLKTMVFPNDSLVWGNKDHDKIRNMKITYPVVYLGNYTTDHVEYSGSHPAIDIKMPQGTPVYAIANGKVDKVSMTEDGFGHHVVIKHVNVPDPDSPGALTTLYSAYNHMDQISVTVGQNILKGTQIGTSGNTGTSTTPHLHFQIDRDSAPWHPYWPFSWKESQAAGLSFFQAVNAGLGQTNAKQYTVNPMKFVAANIGYTSLVTTGNTTVPDPAENAQEDTADTTTDSNLNTDTVTEPEVTEDNVEVVADPNVNTASDKIDTSLFTYKLTGETTALINNGITITAQDELGQFAKLGPDDRIVVDLNGVGELLKKQFTPEDFVNGAIKVIVKSPEPGDATVSIGKSSIKVTFVDKVNTAIAFKIETDGAYQKSRTEEIKIVAVDEDGNTVPAVNFSGVVKISFLEGSGTIKPDNIVAGDFNAGVAIVQMLVPNEETVRIIAQNGALVGTSTQIVAEEKTYFADVPLSHPNYTAIKWMKDNDIINGYDDGTFKPDKAVNRVEALKMLMLAFGMEAGANAQLPFSDTDNGAWYANALYTALGKGIVKGYDDGTFRPSSTVNRAEYLKILFNSSGDKTDIAVDADPYADASKDSWFAPFAYLTNKKNLFDITDNLLKPSAGITRAEVAETIFRMKMIESRGLVSYTK